MTEKLSIKFDGCDGKCNQNGLLGWGRTDEFWFSLQQAREVAAKTVVITDPTQKKSNFFVSGTGNSSIAETLA